MNSPTNSPPWAIRPITPEPVYTDREEPLEYLHQAALKAITRRSFSTVLLGQRRMGKTEIFKRVVNRLFFEQENCADLSASVVPVYYSFEERVVDKWDFAARYAENFLRWYAAFRLRNPDILSEKAYPRKSLVELAESKVPQSFALKGTLNLLDSLSRKEVTDPESSVLTLPRWVSDRDDSTVAMFLDEFQYTRLPQYNFDIVGLMQQAVESPTCPHFVTGSAMSILANEILGRGSLFGRFQSHPIGPLTEYWGNELALRSAGYYKADVPEEMAPVVASRCGGNPFYITAVIQQSVEQRKPLLDEDRINEILAVDLSSGFIWGELNDQVNRWIERINEHGITKWILYLSALEEGEWIRPERIQRELAERDGREVSVETVRDVLVKLSRGDLLEYSELGGWFRKIDDPILLEFLKVWGRMAVEGKTASGVRDDIRAQYRKLKRRIHDHLGYLGEIYMAQILWNSQDGALPARWVHRPEDVPVNWQFSYIHHRVRLGAAPDMEVDVYAAAGAEVWLCESKWWRDRKVGVKEVESLLRKGEKVREERKDLLETLVLWFFAHDGFTPEAEALMAEKEMLWSDRADLDGLLAHVGLKT
ncbi:MAG: hypothetical protein ACOC98_07360, partial [Thermodesulfobacteriota bacterium]